MSSFHTPAGYTFTTENMGSNRRGQQRRQRRRRDRPHHAYRRPERYDLQCRTGRRVPAYGFTVQDSRMSKRSCSHGEPG